MIRNSMCETIEQYAKKQGFPDIRCYIVNVNGNENFKEYAICNDKEWLYGSQRAEDVAIHIDMMKVSNKI